jgi:hypothetical protein
MNTDDLIRQLAAEPPRPAPRSSALWLAGGGALVVAALAFLAFAGTRPDIATAWPATALKIGFGVLALLALAPIVMRGVAPNVRLRDKILFAVALVAFAGLLTLYGLATAPETLRWTLWTGGGLPDCLIRIPLIAAPIAAALFVVARKFGPTRLSVAGAALGAIAGALAIIPYSLFCPIDSVAYVATWYTVSIGICAAIGSLAATRALRW